MDSGRTFDRPSGQHRRQDRSAPRASTDLLSRRADPNLTASNYGGDKHPQWYYNLKANPQCEFGNDPFIATEVTDGDEHARLYGLAEKVYAGWSDYLEKTAASGRRIPVFRLVAR